MKTGIVVIGRNEGQRLVACLQSLMTRQVPIFYVDSGSSDGSVQTAEDLGANAIALDVSSSFTAARARNVGLIHLNNAWPNLEYVQFVDGDCVLVDGWLDAAEAFLDEHQEVAIVCGRVREIHPNATIYNQLCDLEWDTPIGEATICGGISMMRISAISDVGAFRSDMIAGEEPELCLRLREKGWRIRRVSDEMTLHDANMTNFLQWWKRTVRGGFAYATIVMLHAKSPQIIWRQEMTRAIFWGLFLPLSILTASVLHLMTLLLFVLYPLQVVRIAIRRGITDAESWRFGLFMTIAKFAETAGILKYFISHMTGRKVQIIEYK